MVEYTYFVAYPPTIEEVVWIPAIEGGLGYPLRIDAIEGKDGRMGASYPLTQAERDWWEIYTTGIDGAEMRVGDWPEGWMAKEND
jgi:hypothetical protein